MWDARYARFLLHLKRQLVGTFEMFPTAFVCCLVLGLSGLTVARENFNILMLDTRNLQARGNDNWGHGKDYKVTLANDTIRSPFHHHHHHFHHNQEHHQASTSSPVQHLQLWLFCRSDHPGIKLSNELVQHRQ